MTFHNETDAHEPLFVLRQHDGPVLCCAFYPLAKNTKSYLFLSGDANGVAIIWDLSLRRPLFSFHPTQRARTQSSRLGFSSLSSIEGVLAVGFVSTEENKDEGMPDAAQFIPTQDISRVTQLGQVPLHNGENSSTMDTVTPPPLFFKPLCRSRFGLFHQGPDPSAHRCLQETVCFFTQCRDQNLYLWACDLNACAVSSEPRLLHIVRVPQYGFCAVATHYGISGSTVFAIPHDTQGVISVWCLTSVVNEMHNRTASALSFDVSGSSATQDTEANARMATTGMGHYNASVPTETLQQEGERPGSCIAGSLPNGVCSSASVCVAADSPFRLDFLRSFSACARIKGGAIMHIGIKDEHHLSVAFESGHLVLCRYSAPAPQILGIVRAFPEPCMACLWTTERVLATSTGGHVHVYRLLSREGVSAEGGGAPTALSASLDKGVGFSMEWQRAFSKGLGSAVLQDDLAVLGCWDHSIRVLDAQTGNVLTALPFHNTVVNYVCFAPAAAAIEAPFCFDIRQPRCYQCLSTTGKRDDPYREHELHMGVYAFASASKDGCIAVWRLDFRVLPKLRNTLKVTPSVVLPVETHWDNKNNAKNKISDGKEFL